MIIPHNPFHFAKKEVMLIYGDNGYKCHIMIHPRQKWFVNKCTDKVVELYRDGATIEIAPSQFEKWFR